MSHPLEKRERERERGLFILSVIELGAAAAALNREPFFQPFMKRRSAVFSQHESDIKRSFHLFMMAAGSRETDSIKEVQAYTRLNVRVAMMRERETPSIYLSTLLSVVN